MKNEVLNLDGKKTTRKGDIPANVLKGFINTHLLFLTNSQSCTEQIEVPDELKPVDVVPVFKKKDPLNKESNRPVSLLSHVKGFCENPNQTN